MRGLLTRFKVDLGLVDIWKTKGDQYNRFTYKNYKYGHSSRIDFFLVDDLLSKSVKKVDHIPAHLSDHSMVQLELEQNVTQGERRWTLDRTLLLDQYVVNSLENISLNYFQINANGEVPCRVVWEAYKAVIRGNMISLAARNNKEVRSQINCLEADISDQQKRCQLANLEDERNKAIEELSKKEFDLSLYLEKRVRRKWEASSLANYEYGESSGKLLAWKLKSEAKRNKIMAVYRYPDDLRVEDRMEIEEAFVDFFQHLYDEDLIPQGSIVNSYLINSDINQLEEGDREQLNAAITTEEFLKAIKRLKKGKAAGPDAIPNKFYLTLKDSLVQFLVDLFNSIFLEGQPLLESWYEATISLILKPGKDPLRCESYRPISLLNNDYKIFTQILASRLGSCMDKLIHSDQKGFVKGRQLHDLTHHLIGAIDIAIQEQAPLAVLNFDAAKAFDHVNWSFLQAVISHYGLGANFLRAVKIYIRPRWQKSL